MDKIIKIEDQTLRTFFFNDELGKEIQMYKNINENSKYNIKKLKIFLKGKNLIFENYDKNLKYYTPSIKNRNYLNKWNYITHSTSVINLENIFKMGFLDSFEKDNDTEEYKIKKVFTQYMFSDLIYNGDYWYYYYNKYTCILIFSIKLLKLENYIVCPKTDFGRCALPQNKNTQINLGLKKNINILKNFINDEILTDRLMNPKCEKDFYRYRFSHEILFDKIDLKYLIGIIVNGDENYEIVNNLCKKYKLKIKIVKGEKPTTEYKKIYEQFL